MNSIGIGQLKYASKQKTPETPVRILRGRLRNPKEEEKPKDGQLSVDIYQTEDRMVIICPIAGVEKSEIKVAIQDDVLTIRGERKKSPALGELSPLVKELFWGTFSRSIVLPDHIDRKNIKAKVTDALLTISIPKTEDFRTRIIHINDEEN